MKWNGPCRLAIVRYLLRKVPYEGCGDGSDGGPGGSWVTALKSLIRHPHARMGISTVKPCRQGMYDGYYYGSLEYAHLGQRRHMTLSYGHFIMKGARIAYQK